jgi:hypothetical protein
MASRAAFAKLNPATESPMPSPEMSRSPIHPAIVARTTLGDAKASYLQWPTIGRPNWVSDPASATTFPSMREATRMATRLPSGLRAFGLQREPELAISQMH